MEIIRIYRDRKRLLGIILISGVFFGACFIAVLAGVKSGEIGGVKEIKAWVCFGLILPMWLISVAGLFDRRPALEVRKDGLLFYGLSNDVIPWSGISAIRIISVKRQRMVELRLSPNAIAAIKINWYRKLGGGLSKMFGFRHFYIPTSTLEYDA